MVRGSPWAPAEPFRSPTWMQNFGLLAKVMKQPSPTKLSPQDVLQEISNCVALDLREGFSMSQISGYQKRTYPCGVRNNEPLALSPTTREGLSKELRSYKLRSIKEVQETHLIEYRGLPVPLVVCENKKGAVVALIKPEPLFAPSDNPMN